MRPGVEKSVASCHQAGINVIMITGDNIEIAVSIAKFANIIKPNEDFQALTGKDFYSRMVGYFALTVMRICQIVFALKT